MQKLAERIFWKLQLGQITISELPQFMQNLASHGLFAWQFGQIIFDLDL
jgi:hypothetical protein